MELVVQMQKMQEGLNEERAARVQLEEQVRWLRDEGLQDNSRQLHQYREQAADEVVSSRKRLQLLEAELLRVREWQRAEDARAEGEGGAKQMVQLLEELRVREEMEKNRAENDVQIVAELRGRIGQMHVEMDQRTAQAEQRSAAQEAAITALQQAARTQMDRLQRVDAVEQQQVVETASLQGNVAVQLEGLGQQLA